MTSTSEEVRQFWDEQARQFQTDPRATTPDHWMREIEISAIASVLQQLPAGSRVLDIGSGNGFSTIRLLQQFPTFTFVGGDFSPEMVQAACAARAHLSHTDQRRIAFEVMDVTDLPAPTKPFDAVVSDRCLINLTAVDKQWRALGQIASCLRRGGVYVALENFTDGQDNMNAERAKHDLPPIKIRWHNLFLNPLEFTRQSEHWFDTRQVVPISSMYYLVTRVVYSKMCQLEGREPDYDHAIYGIATRLPFVGNFGPIKLVEMVKRDA